MTDILHSSTGWTVNRLFRRRSSDRAGGLRDRLRRRSSPVRLGTLRRTSPISEHFGYDRGTPIDRYYIERFLYDHREHIHGRVVEVKDRTYTDRFGTGVTEQHVLDIDSRNPHATIVADLSAADGIRDATFDCFILTQTLQFIYQPREALVHAHRLLKPGGVLLATVPTITRIDDDEALTDYWRFTPASCSELFGDVFGRDSIRVHSYGNVLSAIAFLVGMAHEELTAEELETHDSRFSILASVCAVKK